MNDITPILTNASAILSHPTWDVILFAGLFAIGVFYGLWAGRKRIISAIIYTYVALALLSAIPISAVVRFTGMKEEYTIQMGVFAITFLILFFFLGRGKVIGFPAAQSWWQTFLLSFIQLGLLAHIIIGFLPPSYIRTFAPLTKAVFATPEYHIWWLLIPIITLIIVRRLGVRDEW